MKFSDFPKFPKFLSMRFRFSKTFQQNIIYYILQIKNSRQSTSYLKKLVTRIELVIISYADRIIINKNEGIGALTWQNFTFHILISLIYSKNFFK